jgi:hypothetical protein
LDTTLSEEGKAADAKAVGDALGEKLGKNEYLTENDKENLTNEIIDKIFNDTLFIIDCGKAEF